MIAAYGLAAFLVAVGVVAIQLGRDDEYLSRGVRQRRAMRIAESSVRAQRIVHLVGGVICILSATLMVLGQIIS